MSRWSAMGAVLALGVPASAGGDKIAWEKPETALLRAQATGMLICWYFLEEEATPGSKPKGG